MSDFIETNLESDGFIPFQNISKVKKIRRSRANEKFRNTQPILH